MNRKTKLLMEDNPDERDDIRGAYARGANSYIRKPVEFSQFTTMLAEVGHYWLDLDSRPQV